MSWRHFHLRVCCDFPRLFSSSGPLFGDFWCCFKLLSLLVIIIAKEHDVNVLSNKVLRGSTNRRTSACSVAVCSAFALSTSTLCVEASHTHFRCAGLFCVKPLLASFFRRFHYPLHFLFFLAVEHSNIRILATRTGSHKESLQVDSTTVSAVRLFVFVARTLECENTTKVQKRLHPLFLPLSSFLPLLASSSPNNVFFFYYFFIRLFVFFLYSIF